MDILRKELNAIYAAQNLGAERLDRAEVARCHGLAQSLVRISNACAVITDASADRCRIFAGSMGALPGLTEEPMYGHRFAMFCLKIC